MMKSQWNKVTDTAPDTGIEVLGFNEKWIDEEVNPTGVCVCYLQDAFDSEWYVAMYCYYHDEWHTRETGKRQDNFHSIISPPTHWQDKPTPPPLP